eukprot:SAG11_NODE_57_length_19200_cov_18.288417_6_plen_203_part_00
MTDPPPAAVVMSALRTREHALRSQMAAMGLNADATDEILEHNWSEGTARDHNSAWKQWEQHCADHLDDTRRDSPSPADLVNFLTRVRNGELSDKQVDTFSAAWVRKVRSTVSATIAMWEGRGMRLGEHPLVSAYIQSITNDDFLHRSRRKYRYDDTWDVELLLTYVRSVVDSAHFTALRAGVWTRRDQPARPSAWLQRCGPW